MDNSNTKAPNVPDIRGFSPTKLSFDCPSVALLEFVGAESDFDERGNVNLAIWVFAFFDFAIYDMELSLRDSFPAARSISVKPINSAEWKFEIELAFEAGLIVLKCRDYHVFSRKPIQHKL